MSVTSPDYLIGAKEVARRYSVHRKTVAMLAKNGKIPAPVKQDISVHPRWSSREIEQHLNTMKSGNQEAA